MYLDTRDYIAYRLTRFRCRSTYKRLANSIIQSWRRELKHIGGAESCNFPRICNREDNRCSKFQLQFSPKLPQNGGFQHQSLHFRTKFFRQEEKQDNRIIQQPFLILEGGAIAYMRCRTICISTIWYLCPSLSR